MERTRRPDRGFTLMEILVAIVVVGILSAVVVLGITSLTSKSAAAACTHSRDAAAAAALAHYTNAGAFPSRLTDMTGTTPAELSLPSGTAIDGTGLVATNANWSLTMAPGAVGVAPTFTCGSGSGGSGGAATTAAGAPTTASATTTPSGGAGTTTSAATTTTSSTSTTTTAAAPTTTAFSSAAGTAACPGSFSGWVGEYYSNTSVSGTPKLCRNDASISFNWGATSPGTGVPADGFSVRWTKAVSFAAGTFTFSMGSADGSRLYIDGVKVLDQWKDQNFTTRSVDRTLTAGTHKIVMEFYDNVGSAHAVLNWAVAD